MWQRTTPTHVFTLPVDPKLFKEIRITYRQGDSVVLKKKTEDCTIDGNKIMVNLTQQETGMFDANQNVGIQMRLMTGSGSVIGSNEIIIKVGKVIDDEVIA